MPKAPEAPKPPPAPIPPSPRDEALTAQQDEIRRKRAATMTRQGTVLTSPTGDPGYGQSISTPEAGRGVPGGASAMGSTRLG